MRKATFFYCLAIFFLTIGVLFAGTPKRTAILEDSASITSEVLYLTFTEESFGKVGRFNHIAMGPEIGYRDRIAVIIPIFDVAIPIDSLITIVAKENSVNVRYLWRGQEITISGQLEPGTFAGKSDFGNIALPTDRLQKLTFKEPAIATAKNEMTPFDIILILADGSKVPAANLESVVSFWPPLGWPGRKHTYQTNNNISFQKGESTLTVDVERIKNIKFQSDKKISVTLKNGKTDIGILGEEIEGFSGIFKRGGFFISLDHVKAIEFGVVQE